MGWLKIQKLEYLKNGTQLLYEIKEFLTRASDGTFWEVIVKKWGNLLNLALHYLLLKKHTSITRLDFPQEKENMYFAFAQSSIGLAK